VVVMACTLSRREFATIVPMAAPALAQSAGESHLGNLYPPIQAIADSSPRELSFLRSEFRDLASWQRAARERLFEQLLYKPGRIAPEVQVLARKQRDGYSEERITFRTTPEFRVPAHVLIRAGQKLPRPGIVLFHDHGGFYVWGREKVIATDDEHPVLTKFKQQAYGGRSIGTELVRQGYIVIAIDMFYCGERRYLLKEDPPAWYDRSSAMTEPQVNDFNRRASQTNNSLPGVC